MAKKKSTPNETAPKVHLQRASENIAQPRFEFTPVKMVAITMTFSVLVVVIVGTVVFLNLDRGDETNSVAVEKQVRSLTEKVGRLIDLPVGETPTVATVSDKNKLVTQPFFVHAENGDKVLIYSNAKKAYLYRPSKNKLIEVGPVDMQNTPSVAGAASASARTTSLTPTPKELNVAIYNGTSISGKAKQAERTLSAQHIISSPAALGNASHEYDSTLVIDLTGGNSETVGKIVSVLGGSPSSLPAGEKSTEGSDILVILGNNN